MHSDLTPINARAKRRPPEAVEDLSLALRARVIWPLEDRLRGAGERLPSLGTMDQTLVAAAALLVAALLGVGGFLLISSHDGRRTTEAAAQAPAPQPTPAPAPQPTEAAAAPTLHGAAPSFKAAGGEGRGRIDGSQPIGGSGAAEPAAGTAGESAGAAKISSKAGGEPATAATSAQGPPAGPAALSVARKFAATFVVYETGGDEAAIRQGFAATTTPELRKALLQRPPHQPSTVKVPKARVLNVVAAPSHGRVYPVSVSLLRVGVTSELRLEMERVKNRQWRVVNVLG